MTYSIYWHLICDQIFNSYSQFHNPQTTVEKLSSNQQYNNLEFFETVMGSSLMQLFTQYHS